MTAPHRRVHQHAEAHLDRGAGEPRAARRNGGTLSDGYFSNGKDFDGVREQLADLREHAASVGRTDGPRLGLNGFVIVRDPGAEARDTLREIVDKAHVEAVEGFGRDVIPIVRELEAQEALVAFGQTTAL